MFDIIFMVTTVQLNKFVKVPTKVNHQQQFILQAKDMYPYGSACLNCREFFSHCMSETEVLSLSTGGHSDCKAWWGFGRPRCSFKGGEGCFRPKYHFVAAGDMKGIQTWSESKAECQHVIFAATPQYSHMTSLVRFQMSSFASILRNCIWCN